MENSRILIIAALVVVLVGFQVVLSLMDGKLPGLVLPIFTLLVGLFAAVYGIIVTAPDTTKEVFNAVLSLVLYLLPSVLLFIIFFVCRKRVHLRQFRQKQKREQKEQRQLEKEQERRQKEEQEQEQAPQAEQGPEQ